jgi:hypothetical protein
MLRSALAFALLALTASPALATVAVAVPEPATLALTGLGAVAAILTMKRR